ncbi:MAG: hypothetical protein L6R39_006899 [Caloplaca ligustica]|nr:MAG: hypothetical protein L6R39_006899 [Caloplaca ligustica]
MSAIALSQSKDVPGLTELLAKSLLRGNHLVTRKGESLEDTIRTVGQYTDAIVLRHPDDDVVDAAAIVSPVPIINGGNGAKEHPTQGLLDLLTIMEELDTVNDRGQLGLTSTELSSKMVSESDVIYCTRIQKERFTDLKLYDKVKDSLTIDANVMKDAKRNMILMHPLPRNKEVTPEVDRDPRAAYFGQVDEIWAISENGSLVIDIKPLMQHETLTSEYWSSEDGTSVRGSRKLFPIMTDQGRR